MIFLWENAGSVFAERKALGLKDINPLCTPNQHALSGSVLLWLLTRQLLDGESNVPGQRGPSGQGTFHKRL